MIDKKELGAYPSNGSRRVSSAGRPYARRVDEGDAVRIVEDDATKQMAVRRLNPLSRCRLRRGRAHYSDRLLGETFSSIAPKYDLLNHLLSFNIDKRWRRALVDYSGVKPGERILDVCTGTGDIAIEFALKDRPGKIVGIDISDKMLDIAQRKLEKLNLTGKITLQKCDCLDIPFENESFDIVTIGFGLRNLTDYNKGISEMERVLKKGGRLLILEFSRPRNVIVSRLYRFYLNTFVVFIGGIISGSKKAYEYLPSSIKGFLDSDGVLRLMQTGDLKDCRFKELAGGIACIHYGRK